MRYIGLQFVIFIASFKDKILTSLLIGLITNKLNGFLAKEVVSTILNLVNTTTYYPSTQSSLEAVTSYLPYVLKADVLQAPSSIRNYVGNIKNTNHISPTEATLQFSLNDDDQLQSLSEQHLRLQPQKEEITASDLYYDNNKNVNWKRVATHLRPLANYHSSGCAEDGCNHNYHNPPHKYGCHWSNCNDMTAAAPTSAHNNVHPSHYPWMMWLVNCPGFPNIFPVLNFGILMYLFWSAINLLGYLLPRTMNSGTGLLNGVANGAAVGASDYSSASSHTNHNYYKNIEFKELH